ncbi:MAG: biopolymer transporter ExbD [Candidatus Cloacimonetes bacterium]|jgi:biopolymer transport protein ExbD|nr:biopolymer transporter ExbD [Candidatus Cloacimonadota bacterium]
MAYGPSKNRSRSQNETREPNLIPIMNLFIVIIPMLMTIMVTVHLAMIEITLPTESAGGGGADEAQEQSEEEIPKVITLALLPDRFEIMVEGIEKIITIPQLSVGTYDYFTLDENISRLKKSNENQGTVELLPDPSVKFDTLLRSIDICKSNNFPNIKYLTSATKFYKAK